MEDRERERNSLISIHYASESVCETVLMTVTMGGFQSQDVDLGVEFIQGFITYGKNILQSCPALLAPS
jgi:hypothetical protein